MTKMLIDRATVEQALEALYEETAWFGPTPKGAATITALRAALAEPDDETDDEPTYCPTCGEEDGGTTCGMPDCGLRCGAEPTTCAWHGDEDGAYETSCKHIFQMLDGTPQENNFTHCCFCGKSMVQHLWEENNDD